MIAQQLDHHTITDYARSLNIYVEPGDCGYVYLQRGATGDALTWYDAKFDEGQASFWRGEGQQNHRPIAWRKGWQHAQETACMSSTMLMIHQWDNDPARYVMDAADLPY